MVILAACCWHHFKACTVLPALTKMSQSKIIAHDLLQYKICLPYDRMYLKSIVYLKLIVYQLFINCEYQLFDYVKSHVHFY